MTPNRKLALVAGAFASLLVGVLAYRSLPSFPEGETTLANVGDLRQGMTIQEAIHTLHPSKRNSGYLSYTFHSPKGRGAQMTHALTPDRYLVVECGKPHPTHGPTLAKWRVEEGRVPQEDVQLDRALKVGPFRIRY